MAGTGRPPKTAEARRSNRAPARGDWRPAPGVGWQHGPVPKPPEGLLPASVDTWAVWMDAWWAAHWIPGDVPALRLVIRLWDVVERGQAGPSLRSELRQLLDGYGITPKGRQDRRWQPPKTEDATSTTGPKPDPYRHLRAVR